MFRIVLILYLFLKRPVSKLIAMNILKYNQKTILIKFADFRITININYQNYRYRILLPRFSADD